MTAVAVVATPPVAAQLPLEPPGTIDGSIDGPTALELVDLDRDGDRDALAATGPSTVAGEIAWWPYDAGTGWGAKQTISTALNQVLDVVAADLDRDGDLDVIVASAADDEVAWFENLAGDASSWSAKKTIVSGGGNAGGAAAVAVADVDGDGDPDVLAAMRDADVIRWLENDGTPGDGGWTLHTVNAAGFDGATAVAVADLDLDGDPDVVGAAGGDHEIAWWENDGSPEDDSGGDGNSWTFHSIGALFDARGVAVADLDGDGDPDVVAISRDGDQLVWFQSSGGAGSWSLAQAIGTPDGPRDLVARDLDFDGDPDLLAAGQDGDELAWWENDGAGGFTEHVGAFPFGGVRGVAVADVDRDGDLDLAATGFTADEILWWENVPIHRTVVWVENAIPGGERYAAVAADVDLDGDPDVVGSSDGDLSWLERTATGWIRHLIDGPRPLAIAVGDLDGDGDPDVVGPVGKFLWWWENDGSPLDDSGGGLGTSWTRHEISNGHDGGLRGTVIADLNRDGIPDVLSADVGGDDVLWWENDGSPADGVGGDGNSWTERSIVGGTTFNPRTPVVGDIDRDGDLDVVVVTQVGTVARAWWENGGDGLSWTEHDIGGGGPLAVALDDVDLDGDLDVLTADGTGSAPGDLFQSLHQAPGDGGNWAVPADVGSFDSGEVFPTAIVSADFDLDGDPDAAGAADGAANVYWWQRNGTSSLLRDTLTSTATDVEWLWAGDADGRRGPDLIMVDKGAGRLVVWENQAAQAELVAVDTSPSAVGDGIVAPLLRLTAVTLGRAGDHAGELARLALLVEETAGDPLTGAELGSLLDALRLYRDDGSGSFEAGTDTLVATLSAFTVTAGRLDFELPDGEANLELSPSPREYFLVAEVAGDASSQGIPTLRVTLVTADSRLEDRTADSPLDLLLPQDTIAEVAVGAPCWTLTLTHECFGNAPIASPSSSATCPAGELVEGETITLQSFPAAGFEVEGWSGTDDDASTTTANTLTMPDADRVVTVIYGLQDDRFLATASLTGTQTIDAESTITAGPAVEVAASADVTFRAPDLITLRDGFSVASGATFTAVVATPPDPCP